MQRFTRWTIHKYRPMASPDLIWAIVVNVTREIDHASYIVGAGRNQAQQLLRWLHSRAAFTRWRWHKLKRYSLAIPRNCTYSSDLWHLQISFEPTTSTLHGIDHASYIVGAEINQAQQLLRSLHSQVAFTRRRRLHNHKTYSLAFPRNCTYGTSDLWPWKETLSISWFALHKSFETSATISISLCIVKLLRKRYWSVLMSKRCMTALLLPFTPPNAFDTIMYSLKRWRWIRLQPCMQ